jgi:hypothetical protein
MRSADSLIDEIVGELSTITVGRLKRFLSELDNSKKVWIKGLDGIKLPCNVRKDGNRSVCIYVKR